MDAEQKPTRRKIRRATKWLLWAVCAIVAAFVLLLGFYRTVVRPEDIRRECDAQAHQQAATTTSAYDTFLAYENRYDFFYASCVRSRGAQPESS